MRIGFLFNHDQVHQVAHSLPIALALRRLRPDVDVTVAVTGDHLAQEVSRLCRRAGKDLPITSLAVRGQGRRALVRLLDPVAPATRVAIYGDNLEFFRSLDALVVPEKTSLILKRRFGLAMPLIHTRHGAGDRAIGFNAQSAAFDHVLVSGAKIAERLVAEAGVLRERISIVGYPKFDLSPSEALLPFADPTRPTVLYNPHVSPHLSSWYRQGRAVLNFFARSDRFNLVFAPHVMLFRRRLAMSIDRARVAIVPMPPPRLLATGNIHVDLGSPACTDMTYTQLADIYLGDVSSQVYEFLRRPRPCLFLAGDRRSVGDASLASWAAGPVISDAAKLGPALERAITDHPYYLPIQRDLFERSFDLRATPSSDRAAMAVLRVAARETVTAIPMDRPLERVSVQYPAGHGLPFEDAA